MFLLFVVLACAYCSPANGFWDVPHMLVPQIAVDSGLISDQTMKCVDTVFLQSYYKDFDHFINAGVWADHIKTSAAPFGLGYLKGTKAFNEWHFIDFPLVAEGGGKCDTEKEENIVYALSRLVSKEGRDELAEKGPMPISPGVALRLITHFIGDLHQPLHCVSRCDSVNPEGDMGGNLFYVDNGKYTTQVKNLHSFWDSGAGQYDDVQAMSQNDKLAALPAISKKIISEFPVAAKKGEISYNTADDFSTWAKASFDLAKNDGYTDALVRNSECNITRHGKVTTHDCAKVPDEYRKNAQRIIRLQLALAGYRLANIIDTHFYDCKAFFPQYGVATGWAIFLCILFAVIGCGLGGAYGRKVYFLCLALRSGMGVKYIEKTHNLRSGNAADGGASYQNVV